MMDFITIPLVVGIITLGIYKLFELFARRKERITLIEKLGEKIDPEMLKSSISLPSFKAAGTIFGTLRFACLLLGVGLGLLIAFFICHYTIVGNTPQDTYNSSWDIAGMVYGACTLLFGGLGLLIAFVVELKYSKKD